MSKRALLIGFLGAVIICSVTFLNDWVLRQTFLVGNHMPVSVYGGLLVLLLFNGAILRFQHKWAFNRGEIAVILGMTLASCCIPSSGLMRTFTTSLMLPHHFAKSEGGWSRNRLTDELAPPNMLADVSKIIAKGGVSSASEDSVVLDQNLSSAKLGDIKIRVEDTDGFRQVRRLMAFDEATQSYSLDQPWQIVPEAGTAYEILANNEADFLVPFAIGNPDKPKIRWSAWGRTLLFWIPLILCMWGGMIGLSLVVHRQWTNHEQLPYPIAKITQTLLPNEHGKSSSVFQSRGFWIAAGIVCFIYINNYVQAFYPESWVQIPTQIDISPLVRLVDITGNAKWCYSRPIIFFSVVAIAYFLASDISLSVGLAPLIYGVVSAFLIQRGVDMKEGGTRAINNETFFLFGSYLGLFLMIVYTGRQFYFNTARQALRLKSKEDIPRYAVWGARFCAISAFCFMLLAVRVGLDWYIALLYFAGLMVLMVVMGRILAETGLFFIQPDMVISSILIGLFGPSSIGLEGCLILFLFSAILAFDPREALMPYLVNSANLLDKCNVKIGRATAVTGLTLVIALAVAVPVTLRLQHTHGGSSADSWGSNFVPRFAFNNTLRLKQRLEEQWDSVSKEQILGKGISAAQPMKWKLFIAAGIGLAGAMGFAGLRLRLNWWPLHPVMFLICTSYASSKFGPAFLLGWLIKLLVSKYGGSKVYQSMKPIMIGLIVGEIAGALIPVIVGYIIYWTTGEPPSVRFSVFPT